jgi:hypothetical protein
VVALSTVAIDSWNHQPLTSIRSRTWIVDGTLIPVHDHPPLPGNDRRDINIIYASRRGVIAFGGPRRPLERRKPTPE